VQQRLGADDVRIPHDGRQLGKNAGRDHGALESRGTDVEQRRPIGVVTFNRVATRPFLLATDSGPLRLCLVLSREWRDCLTAATPGR
jgi:hypothetical protein